MSKTKGTAVKRKLLAPIAGLVMAISAGLGFTHGSDADAFTASPAVMWSSAQNDEAMVRGVGVGLSGDGSSVSALANKLGEKEQTVADALMAVSAQERSAATPMNSPFAANPASSRAARQAAVAAGLAAQLGIGAEKVGVSLTELQAARRVAGTSTAS